jgi:hypothetical protein
MASYKAQNTSHCFIQYCVTNKEVTDCPPVHCCYENITLCIIKRKVIYCSNNKNHQEIREVEITMALTEKYAITENMLLNKLSQKHLL